MAKTFGPREVVGAIKEVLKDAIRKHQEAVQNSSAKVGDKVSESGPANSTEVIRTGTQYLLGQEPTHTDALEHHATLAVAQFNAGREDLAKTHKDLAVAHAGLAGIDAEKFLKAVYGQFEDMVIPTEEFIPHGMDSELEKAQTLKGGKPSFEAFDDASGVGVDKRHIGKTPDDQKSQLLNDPQKDVVKPEVKKDEDDDEEHHKHVQRMIDDGSIWHFEGAAGRHAMDLMRAGKVILGSEARKDYWGNRVPAHHEVKPGTLGSKEYAARMRDKAEKAEVEPIDKSSEAAQDYISDVISDLVRDKGYSQDRAVAAAHNIAREKGYKVTRKFEVNEPLKKPVQKSESFIEMANRELFAHQLGLFKAEPLAKIAAPPSSAQSARAMAMQPPRKGPAGAIGMMRAEDSAEKAEDSESTTSTEEEVEKAGEFKSKQVRDIRQAKGYTRARPSLKTEELSADQDLDGKGRPENNEDRKNAVLHKDKESK